MLWLNCKVMVKYGTAVALGIPPLHNASTTMYNHGRIMVIVGNNMVILITTTIKLYTSQKFNG